MPVIASDLPPVWVEAGPTVMHYTPDKIDTSAGMYHVATTEADHGLAAAGGRLRMFVEIDHGWYAGIESDIASFDGPALTGSWSERGATMTMDVASHGTIEQGKLVLGKRVMLGRWAVGGELAPGLQVAQYTSTNIPNYVEPWTQSWYVIEAHGIGSVWVADRVSLTVEASADALHPDRAQLAVLVGGHLDNPFAR